MRRHRRNVILLVSHRTYRNTCRTCRRCITHLAAYDQHRDTVQPCSQNSRQCIRASRSCRTADDWQLIRRPVICLSRHCRRLFMVHKYIMHPLFMAQRHIQVHSTPARHCKIIPDSLICQEISNPVRNFNFHMPPSICILYVSFHR